eukprot:CAMPEP_0119014686 /NCGR_PEP_ID=MMETSP1176-20130426/10207_1 /TAXON_ID=265551 /ORGANISM="Synedropsis recta cf, Strain CCMP1620" /LENGTH=121 /DNA_ID=CAMNT_0006967907 /DNA_START=220 /DNA_END=585 /DNA_ORIENTATION=+
MGKIVEEESWSSFHKKHHTEEFHYSAKNEAVRMSPFCSAGSLRFFEDDDDDCDGKGWFSGIVDLILTGPSQAQKKKARKVLSDDASCSSSDSKQSSSRRRFARKNKTVRRKGNVKLSNFSR